MEQDTEVMVHSVYVRIEDKRSLHLMSFDTEALAHEFIYFIESSELKERMSIFKEKRGW
tara:strand:- start:962 stop:1138 length:177 start_codon:yes stop_codon:yes gene_type:complete